MKGNQGMFTDYPTDRYGSPVAMAFNRVVTNKRSRELLLNALTERSQLLSEMVDSRRNLNSECHYPETRDVSPGQYKDLYDRFSLANRVVECLPRESWQVAPKVFETSDPDTTTPFEEAWNNLQPTTHGQSWYIGGDHSASVWEYLMRADILAGIGHFGLLLLGVDDGRNLQEPIEGTITFNSRQFEDCFLTKEEEDAIRESFSVNNKAGNPPLNKSESDYLDELARQRAYIINALQQRERQRDAKPWEVGYGNPSKKSSSLFGDATGEQQLYTGDMGTDAQYQQGYGMTGEAQYKPSAEGTDQQYFGVQFGPTEMPGKNASKRKLNLLFLRPFDESLVQVVRYEWNINNPRFGMPVMYRITLNDPRELHSGVGLPMATVFVHWSRVIHIADNLGSSEIFGAPRMRPVLNNLLDLQKVYGASAEGYWQAALAGIVLETHPQLGGDVTYDAADVRDQLENYVNSLQRYLALTGMSAHTLAPTVGDPLNQVAVQIEAICIKLGIPVRIFKGSERGELASSQDDAAWNDRLKLRQNIFITPRIIVPFIDRLISIGVLPEPNYVPPEDMNADQSGFGADTTFPQEEEGEEVDGQFPEHEGVSEEEDRSTLGGRGNSTSEDLEEVPTADAQTNTTAEDGTTSQGEDRDNRDDEDVLLTKNAFCPTGEGGGQDNSCSSESGKSSLSGKSGLSGQEAQNRVADIIAGSTEQKDSVASWLSTKIATSEYKAAAKLYGAKTPEELSDGILHGWVGWGYAEHSPPVEGQTQLILQLAAQDEFKDSKTTLEHFSTLAPEKMKAAKNYYQQAKTIFRGCLREQYSKTQQWLKKHNVSTIEIYRGANVDTRQPLESWTLDSGIASEFGELNTKEIPASQVLSVGGVTGIGDRGEFEVVILGNKPWTTKTTKMPTENIYDPHEEDIDPNEVEEPEVLDEDFDPTTSDDQPNLTAQPTNKTKTGYHIEWPDLESNTELSKAQIAATKTQAMATYVSGNVESIMPLIEFLTHILGIEEDKARAIVQAAEEQQMEQQQEQAMQNPFTDQQPAVDENGFPVEEQQNSFDESTDDGIDGANPFEEPIDEQNV